MSVASLNAKLTRLKNEKKTLTNRKSDIEKVVKKLNKDPIDDVDDIKKSANKTANQLEDGIKGIGRIGSIVDYIRDSARDCHGLNDWMESVYLSQEIRRLNNQINSVNADIRRVEAELEEARRAERDAALAALVDIFR